MAKGGEAWSFWGEVKPGALGGLKEVKPGALGVLGRHGLVCFSVLGCHGLVLILVEDKDLAPVRNVAAARHSSEVSFGASRGFWGPYAAHERWTEWPNAVEDKDFGLRCLNILGCPSGSPPNVCWVAVGGGGVFVEILN